MAYYNPYAWNPGYNVPAYGYGMNPNPQPMPNPVPPQQNFQQPAQNDPEQDIIKVHGKEGALALANSLGKNRAKIAIDETEEDIEWLIVTDGAGFPTLKRLRFMEADDTPQTQKEEEGPVYVTTKEFDALKATVDKLMKDLGGDK